MAVIGVERQPGVRHLHHVGRLAGRDHGGEFLERLVPGQRDDLDLDAGIGGLELADDRLQRLGALRAGDDLDQLQRGVGQARCRAISAGEARRSNQLSSCPFPPCFVDFMLSVIRRGCDRRFEIAPQRLGSLEADMEAHRPRMDAEIDARNWAAPSAERTTSPGTIRLSWPPQLTPSLNSSRRSAEGADIDALAEDEGEQARRAVEPGRQAVGEAGMVHRVDASDAPAGAGRSRGRPPHAPACGSAACAGRGSAARHRRATACRRDRDRPRARMLADQLLASRRRRRPRRRCGRRDISRPNGGPDRRRARSAAGRSASPSCCR